MSALACQGELKRVQLGSSKRRICRWTSRLNFSSFSILFPNHQNWKREFRKWIGWALALTSEAYIVISSWLLLLSPRLLLLSNNSINVLAIDSSGQQKIESFVRSKTYQVLIIGYEKLRTCISVLKGVQPPIGLIVCDEGHRLKSKDAKTTKMFDELTTRRRIILSGTPIQVSRNFGSLKSFFSNLPVWSQHHFSRTIFRSSMLW